MFFPFEELVRLIVAVAKAEKTKTPSTLHLCLSCLHLDSKIRACRDQTGELDLERHSIDPLDMDYSQRHLSDKDCNHKKGKHLHSNICSYGVAMMCLRFSTVNLLE